MTLQPPLRSTTPNKIIDDRQWQRHASYNSFPYANANQLYSQNNDLSASLLAAKNILQRPLPEIRHSSVIPRKNIHHGNYFFAPDPTQHIPKKQNQLSKRVDENPNQNIRWNQIIQNQIDTETKAMIEQKIEERLRKQQYKANLDELVMKKSTGNHNQASHKEQNFEEEYQNVMLQLQLSNKREIKQVLDRGVQERQSLYNQMMQEKYQDRLEVEKRMMDAQVFEQMQKELAKSQKQKLMNEIKDNLDQHIQLRIQENKEKFETEKEYAERLSAELAERDRQNAEFYKQIRENSIVKNKTRNQRLEAFQKDSHTKNKSIDEIIEQNRVDKIKQEEIESIRREQYRKQIYRQNFKENQNIAQEKYLEYQSNRHAQEQISEQIKAQIEDATMFEIIKKQNQKDYKRRYLDYLNQQVAEKKRNNNVTGDELSRAEKLMILRGSNTQRDNSIAEIENTTLPNGKNGYERRLQLSYIDKWLKHNPSLPPENHERIKRPHFAEEFSLGQN